jgi:hypothetical protein
METAGRRAWWRREHWNAVVDLAEDDDLPFEAVESMVK